MGVICKELGSVMGVMANVVGAGNTRPALGVLVAWWSDVKRGREYSEWRSIQRGVVGARGKESVCSGHGERCGRGKGVWRVLWRGMGSLGMIAGNVSGRVAGD